ncbi:MAG: hypothetical protein AAFN93_03115 [Bacteroidota bacterium]
MNEEEDKEEKAAFEIPEEFHSMSTGGKFERCIDCDRYLLDENEEYFIEKAIKKYPGFKAQDVIFEYAICIHCAERMRSEMSTESLNSLETYMMENTDIARRMEIVQANPNNPLAWMQECLIKGVSQEELTEYQIYAHCQGDKLNLMQMPYMVSSIALDEISQLLSDKTLDQLNGFMDEHFGPPPELKEPLPSRRRVILV